MGVRVALGAESRDILSMILRQGLSMGLPGIGLGVAGAIAVRRFLASFLYRISGADPLTLVACSAIILIVVVAASIVPARRATRIDPLRALRSD
jgi:ABC-type antimicrobial peptide transport system permease subunit